MAAITICSDFGAPSQNKVCHCFSTDHITSAQYSTLEAETLTRLTKFYVPYNPVGIVWVFMLRGTGTPAVGLCFHSLILIGGNCPSPLRTALNNCSGFALTELGVYVPGGGQERGRQRMRRLDGIPDSVDVGLSELREAWRAAVHGFAESRT